MAEIASVRIAVPKPFNGELGRRKLAAAIAGSSRNLVYIQGGAGYGKTTLLSQVAGMLDHAVWLTLDGENDVYMFLDILSKALQHVFPEYAFHASEYLPFEGRENFATILANAWISSVEKLAAEITVILEDLHTVQSPALRALLTCMLKYCPDHIRLCISSREAPWQDLIPLRVKGRILELTQNELAFTREEVARLLGFDDETILSVTEGWPLAVGSFKVLLENGVSLDELPTRGNQALYSYLFCECISRLPVEMVEFLGASACFEELDVPMLNAVLGLKNAGLLLNSLTARNMFTLRTEDGQYRYHSLFRDYLADGMDPGVKGRLSHQAAAYYMEHGQYQKAAQYAMRTDDKAMLEQILLLSYKEAIKSGRFSELRIWFSALGGVDLTHRELLVAKGAYLSSIGHFTEAKQCLDMVIPLLKETERELYLQAMVHKARVLRNHISFEASNRVLDELMDRLTDPVSEQTYSVVIEKIYNLCWNSQINEAYALAYQMVHFCAKAGNVKVRAWYERYLSVIHYVAGRMKESVYYYEKSLQIPQEEQQYLDMHSVDIYVAKSYQMLGRRDMAVSLVTAGLQKLRSTGRYEELWLGYLFAAEIHYQNTSIDRSNGSGQTFETTVKYFTLADEYAPLYRKSAFQQDWTNLQRNIYELMFKNGAKENNIREIFADIPRLGDHFKTIALGRLFNYFGSISDFTRARECARRSIEIGERANTMMVATMAYGFLARLTLSDGKDHEAVPLVRRFLQLCHENGIYEYFRMRTAYDPVLEFALDNGSNRKLQNRSWNLPVIKGKSSTSKPLAVFPSMRIRIAGNRSNCAQKKRGSCSPFCWARAPRGPQRNKSTRRSGPNRIPTM